MPEQMPRSERANGLTERRQRRQNLTDKQVAALPRKRQRYVKADPELRGHYLRVPPSGPITFSAVARDPYGRRSGLPSAPPPS